MSWLRDIDNKGLQKQVYVQDAELIQNNVSSGHSILQPYAASQRPYSSIRNDRIVHNSKFFRLPQAQSKPLQIDAQKSGRKGAAR